MYSDLISVILTTYERPDALDAVLRSLSRQTDRNYEIVIADDGSGGETEKVVGAWQRRLQTPLKHVWQCDKGFRAALVRNRAVLASVGGYLVFLDGDCVAWPDFVAAHRRLAEARFIVGGDRVWLSKSLTHEVLARGEAIETWSRWRWVRELASRRIDRPTPLLRIPGQLWRQWGAAGPVSCNASLYRDDFFAVDGFDASFEGWGCEDLDLAQRLRRSGVRYKSGKRATGVFHLWHPKWGSVQEAHLRLLRAACEGQSVKATIGLSSICPPELRCDAGKWT